MNSKIEQAFEEKTNYVFVLILPTPTLTPFFSHFLITFKKII